MCFKLPQTERWESSLMRGPIFFRQGEYENSITSPTVPQGGILGEWESSFCDVYAAGSETCLLGFFCPCVLFGRSAEMLDQNECKLGGWCLLPGFLYVLHGGVAGCVLRSAIRERYGMATESTPIIVLDFLANHLFPPCAIIQVKYTTRCQEHVSGAFCLLFTCVLCVGVQSIKKKTGPLEDFGGGRAWCSWTA